MSYIKVEELIGKRFGRLVVLGKADDCRHIMCKCDCGNIATVNRGSVLRGNTKSCGCLRREITSKNNTTHGKRHHRLYSIWIAMKNRCKYPSQNRYESYGGRGICVCDEWVTSFESFYNWAIENGYKDGLSIDRINVDGNYSPENCRWATSEEQSLNRTDNRFITYNGETKTIKEWCDETGLAYSCLLWRIDHGWDIGRALTTQSRLHKEVPIGTRRTDPVNRYC